MAPPDLSDKAIPESGNGLAFKPVSRRAKPQRRWGLIFGITFVVLIIGTAGAGYFVFEGSLEEGDEFRVPLVRAKPGPIKTLPKNPGGRDVQHRDKLVYDRLQGGAERTPVEVLNPPPEAPLPPPKTAELPKKVEPIAPPLPKVVPPVNPAKTPTSKDVASIKTPTPAPMSPVVELVKPKVTSKAKPKPKLVKRPPPPPPVVKSSLPKPKPEKFVLKSLENSKPKPLPAPKSVRAPKVNKPAAPVAPSISKAGSKIKIQLAAVRSVERATTEWSRLRRKHADLLKGLSLTVTKADLGPGKGIFYRLRAGPVATESTAKSICAQLTKRKIGCLVVRGK